MGGVSDDLGAGEVKHAAVGTSVETVTLDADHQAVRILKRTSAGELWVVIDSSTDPEAEADGVHCMPEGINELALRSPDSRATTVKMIASAGTINVSVTGLRP